MSSFLELALRQRVLVIALACLIAVAGIYSFRTIAIDAFPDVTTVLVQVVTEVQGLSPAEIERFVTFPLELQLTGAPGLTDIRSLSKVGLSMITVVFRDDVDIYLARQLVLERVLEVQDSLPPGARLGARAQFAGSRRGVSILSGRSARQRSGLPADRDGVDGAADAGRLGHPSRCSRACRTWSMSIRSAGSSNNIRSWWTRACCANTTSRFTTSSTPWRTTTPMPAATSSKKDAEKYIVRGIGLIKTLQDIENIVVKEARGTPVYVSDVAEVQIGHAVRHGAAVLNGQREVVAGIVLMLRGGNAREVVQAVKDKIEDIHEQKLLPDGLRIVPFYDRIELIVAALQHGLQGPARRHRARHCRAVPVPGQCTQRADRHGHPRRRAAGHVHCHGSSRIDGQSDVSRGLVIAIGMMVDGSVVVVENVYRHLSRTSAEASVSRSAIVLKATKEVAQPVLFGILIIILVFLPILSLQGMEGKMFKPLAYTIMIALLVSLLLSLTLSPALCSMALTRGSEEDPWLLRKAKQWYAPSLSWALDAPAGRAVRGGGDVGAPAWRCFRFSAENSFPFSTKRPSRRKPSGFPASRSRNPSRSKWRCSGPSWSFRKSGWWSRRSAVLSSATIPRSRTPAIRSSRSSRWMNGRRPRRSRNWMMPIRRRIEQVPGANFLLSQPIQQRVDELLSGVRSEATVKVIGEDLEQLRKTAEQIQAIMTGIAGVKDVRVEQLFGQAYLTIDIDRGKIARHGINVAHIREIISTAIGAEAATRVYEGQKRFDLILRYPKTYRDSVETISNILLTTATGCPDSPGRAGQDRVARRAGVDQPGRSPAKDLRRLQYARTRHRKHRRGSPGQNRQAGAAADGLSSDLGRVVRKHAARHGASENHRADHDRTDLFAVVRLLQFRSPCRPDHSEPSLRPDRRDRRALGHGRISERAGLSGIHQPVRRGGAQRHRARVLYQSTAG